MPRFLIVRPDDLVHLGIQWDGFRLEQASADGRPRLTAISDRARITITFPPQVLSERAITSGVMGSALPAHRAGTSHVQLAIPGGTFMDLDDAASLGALRKPGVTTGSRGVNPGEETNASERAGKRIVAGGGGEGGGEVVGGGREGVGGGLLDGVGGRGVG